MFDPKNGVQMSQTVTTHHPLFYITGMSEEIQNLALTIKPFKLDETQFLKKLIPIKIKIGKNIKREREEVLRRQKNNLYNYAEYILWYEATPEFIEKLPERYKGELMKELNIIESFEKGTITKEEACSNINDKHDYFNFCESFSATISNVILYPYPAQEDIHCSFELKKSCKISFMLFDLDGKPVKTIIKDKYFQAGNQVERLDLNEIKRGMYMLVIIPSDGDQAAVKLVR
jgi:hypothetical protein